METKKDLRSIKSSMVTAEELSRINEFAKCELGASEVYTFAVKLCDNEIDRDCERFTRQTLTQLAELFVGKCGIFDHEWSAKEQTARIYRTELVETKERTKAGDSYCYLKGYAYMLRTEKNEELIAEIEGGIKKEVSVGCSVKESVCSVCGKEIGICGHEKGKVYDGKLCYAELKDASDAYEWSFVAVPAQPKAGVMKRYGQEEAGSLKALVKQRGSRANLRELEKLEKQAELGRTYLGELRKDVCRLMLTAEKSFDGETVEKMTEKLGEEELRELHRVYGEKSAKMLGTQLCYAGEARQAEDESDFRV